MTALLGAWALVVSLALWAVIVLSYRLGKIAGIEQANRIWAEPPQIWRPGEVTRRPMEPLSDEQVADLTRKVATRRQCSKCWKDCADCVCAKVQKVSDDIETTLSSAKKGGRA